MVTIYTILKYYGPYRPTLNFKKLSGFKLNHIKINYYFMEWIKTSCKL
jgi:hypothetical protein